MSAARIARTLGGTPTGGGFICRCPVASHGSGRGDRRPSLSVKDGVCGVLVYCHSGCSARDVLDELRRRGLLDGPLTMNQRVRGARDSEIRDFRKPSTAPGNDRGTDDRARTCRRSRYGQSRQPFFAERSPGPTSRRA